jgi:hypothetical protein
VVAWAACASLVSLVTLLLQHSPGQSAIMLPAVTFSSIESFMINATYTG